MGGKTGIEAVADRMVANVGAETGLSNQVMLRFHKPLLDAVNGVPPTDPTRLTHLRNNSGGSVHQHHPATC